jgi:hypothetical protein
VKEGVEDEYDIELIDFKPELGEELYLKLIDAGLETAKDVINAKLDTLLAIEGLTEPKVAELREMMRRDLEEAEVDDEDVAQEPGEPSEVPAGTAAPSAEETPQASTPTPTDEDVSQPPQEEESESSTTPQRDSAPGNSEEDEEKNERPDTSQASGAAQDVTPAGEEENL